MSVVKSKHPCPKGFRRLRLGEVIRNTDIHWHTSFSTFDPTTEGLSCLRVGMQVNHLYANAVYRRISEKPLTSAPVSDKVSDNNKGEAKMISALNRILARGTRIVSFDYDGKARNVLVGSKRAAEGTPVWGSNLNRAIREHGGQRYLLAIDNNDDHTIKTFALDKIERPCALLVG